MISFSPALTYYFVGGMPEAAHFFAASNDFVGVREIQKEILNAYSDRSIFKIYSLDVGLLGALARTSPDILTYSDRLFTEYKGAFVENYVAQQLKSHKETDLYYWKSDGLAEVDFLYEHGNDILPLEAKAGISPRSKSLKLFAQKYKTSILSRTTLLNLKQDGNFHNYPLYAISLFPELSISAANRQ